jgi:hypothetical protein
MKWNVIIMQSEFYMNVFLCQICNKIYSKASTDDISTELKSGLHHFQKLSENGHQEN